MTHKRVFISRCTFFCRAQWRRKMNMPCKALKEVKRYAITTLLSLINNRPKIHVRETSKRRVTELSVQHLSQRNHTHSMDKCIMMKRIEP